ncbi:MAG: AAA family ATPase [Crocinitomicaceae bacterium]|nr:AAA family ATPase [Crocinitomicaceae bacterium]MBK8925456.1 AAA family ATPase [Crocinitomicaceae bacterium]
MIGRKYEIKRLNESLKSKKSELIAVYGRRRVGKTYLIRKVYEKHIKFEVTGLYGGNHEKQLDIFFYELKKLSKKIKKSDKPKNWKDAFELLKTYINSLRGKSKKVIFIDEMPWLDTHKSDFRMYFGHFWNTYCEKRNDIVIVLCGSAASYMVQNVISNQGSLHARLTYKLQIKPFTLFETKEFLKTKNISWGHYHILHLYLAIGGIPHYLNKIKKGESVVQSIQRLCFDTNGDLVNEFNEIFESLFTHSSSHISIVRALGKSGKGIPRDELITKSKHAGGGAFTRALEELIASGFVTKYPAFDKKVRKMLYRLTDEYSKFYLKYIEPNKNQGENFWKTMFQQQTYLSWAGFNFETICLKHVPLIKKALKIEGIHSNNSSWSVKGAQVDLVIKRADNWVNLCEMKFYSAPLKIGKKELISLRNKVSKFKADTRTKDVVVITMITTYGVVEDNNSHEIVENSFTMDILFEDFQ